MKIFTNCLQLRLSGDYLYNIDIEFLFSKTNVFTLAQYQPNIIITEDTYEAEQASQKYPDIKFIGPEFSFPNYKCDIPKGLLDELSVINNKAGAVFQKCDISYFNTQREENLIFIKKLQSLGNVKIIGEGYSPDECIKKYPKRLSPCFYKFGKYGAATDLEEMYKILFMDIPCITNADMNYCYNGYKLNDILDLHPIKNQVIYAWDSSHTVFLSKILSICGYEDQSEKLKQVINFN